MELAFHVLIWWAIAAWIAVKCMKPTRETSLPGLLLGTVFFGAFAWYAGSSAVEALTSGVVRCPGRSCGDIPRAQASGAFWLAYVQWFAASVFMGGAALSGLLRMLGIVRVEPDA
jgi:hypothetical protein